ncbi:MAG: hypothetical protein HY541_08935 [Deltaproteobacteria bacterium]|nr:hypothetical protein [Deltaproteobacteria bacterium]
MFEKKTKTIGVNFLTVAAFALLTVHCGGGGSGGAGNTVDPIISTDPNGDLSSQAVNTFVDNGIEITIDPSYVDLGSTGQYNELKGDFTLTNGTSEDKTLAVSFYGTGGGFRLVNDDDSQSASEPGFILTAGASRSFTVKFDASTLGAHNGYVEITAREVSGYIHFPFRAKVTGPSDFRILSSSYMCSNEDAPDLTELDFMRVASGKMADRSFKICNIGSESIRINSIQLETSTSGATSEVFSLDPFEEFLWDVEETMNSAYSGYFNPPQTESFTEPQYITYDGAVVDATTAFTVTERSSDRSPDGIVIASGSYAVIDVEFEPTLNIEAPEGQLYEPIAYSANMAVDTSLGEVNVDLLGATGGKEPVLKVTYTTDESDACLADETTECAQLLDIDSQNSSISFGTVSIFEDWIPEAFNEVVLKLQNTGSGSKSLQLWADAIDAGYFTFVDQSDDGGYIAEFPHTITTGHSALLKLRYAPTPSDGTAQDFYDMGQLVLKHTAGNGPTHGVTLVGEQESAYAVRIFDENNAKLKKEYDSPKSLCNFLIDENTDTNGDGADGNTTKKFTITNYSPNYTLKSTITTGGLYDVEDGSVGNFTVDQSTISTVPSSSSEFTVTFFVDNTVVAGTEVHGTLTIQNDYPDASEDLIDPTYAVYFKATAAESGLCTGVTGEPLNGSITLLVDRITMILDGVETARNPSSYRLHIPVELDKTNNVARMGGAAYDPVTSDPNAIDVFRIYNHQMGNVNKCYALPTTPYYSEAKEGSWTDPETQCPSTGTAFTFTGSETCIPPNKPEEVTVDGVKYYVFYHEFVKFTPGTCAVELEGKIATFYFKEGQTIEEVFQEMEDNVGLLRDDTPVNRHKYQDFLKMFQFDSFIKFSQGYNLGSCVHSAGETLDGDTQSEDIRTCWETFMDDTSLRRYQGMIEECTYFLFDVEEGCFPDNMPGVGDKDPATVCKDENSGSDWNDPDTWVGLGEYEPSVDPQTGEESDTKWDITMRNIHLQGSFVFNALNGLFDNPAKLLFADLYATLTTKAIGHEHENWQDLIAVQNQDDFSEDDVYQSIDDAKFNWLEDGANSEFTAGTENDVDCFVDGDYDQPKLVPSYLGPFSVTNACRGNFMVTDVRGKDEVIPAGEPVNFSDNNLFLLVALGAFHGKPGLAPSFAQERGDGSGKPLVFSIHGCLKDGEDIAEDAGCYEGHIDSDSDLPDLLRDYKEHGILSDEDYQNAISSEVEDQQNSDTWIDYIIFDEDRNRYTDYYNSPDNYYIPGMVNNFSGGFCPLLN